VSEHILRFHSLHTAFHLVETLLQTGFQILKLLPLGFTDPLELSDRGDDPAYQVTGRLPEFWVVLSSWEAQHSFKHPGNSIGVECGVKIWGSYSFEVERRRFR
jgi:hypothetical protein